MGMLFPLLKFTALMQLISMSTALNITNGLYYVTPTASTPCPKEGVPCFTLSKYASMPNAYFTATTNLVLLPGNHHLNNELEIINIKQLALLGIPGSHSSVKVECEASGRFSFENINNITISELEIFGCVNNTIKSVSQFNLKECVFNADTSNNTQIATLVQVSGVPNATVINSYFSSNTSYNSTFINDLNEWDNRIGRAVIVNTSSVLFVNTQFNSCKSGAIVSVNSNVNIVNVTFINNWATLGGAVYHENSLVTILDTTFSNNIATKAGGALYFVFSIVSASNSQFHHNAVIESDDDMENITRVETIEDGSGGAIHLRRSNATIESCTFIGNTATLGGVICHQCKIQFDILMKLNDSIVKNESNTVEISIRINSCSFINNVAKKHTSTLYSKQVNTEIENSLFSNNNAFYSGTVDHDDGNITIKDTTFTNNTANDHGVLYFYKCGTVDIKNSLFANNIAVENTAAGYINTGILTIENTIFSNNTANNSYGALYIDECTVAEIKNSVFDNNRALQFTGALSIDNSKLASVENTTFSGNTAFEGGALYISLSTVTLKNDIFTNNIAVSDCGAVCISGSNAELLNSKFSNNSAKKQGGAFSIVLSTVTITNTSTFTNNTASVGGVIYSTSSTLNISKSMFSNNTATFAINRFGMGGGALYILGNLFFHSNLVLKDVSFTNNTATNGGAIFLVQSTTTIEGGTFTNNTAYTSGGALYLSMTQATISYSTFTSNAASWDDRFTKNQYISNTTYKILPDLFNTIYSLNPPSYITGAGGVLFLLLSTLEMFGCTFRNNSADEIGGAVASLGNGPVVIPILNNYYNHYINITDTVFNCNTAPDGGALSVFSTTLHSYGILTVENNRANSAVFYAIRCDVILSGTISISGNHGSLYVFSSNLTFDGQANVTNNTQVSVSQSNVMGGAISAFQSEILLKGTVNIKYNNAANKFGGAISLTEGKLFIHETSNVEIVNNTALSGGGIFAYQSELTFKGICSIKYNSAQSKGGGLYAVSTTTRLSASTSEFKVVLLQFALKFIWNTAKKGGGIYLESGSKLYIIKVADYIPDSNPLIVLRENENGKNPTLEFTNNCATYGGAIYVSDDTYSGTCANRLSSPVTECFLQAFNLVIYSKTDFDEGSFKSHEYLINTHFANNTALHGMTLYGGLLDRCTVSPFAEIFYTVTVFSNFTQQNSLAYLTTITNLQRTELDFHVSSEAVRVCFCQDNASNCSYHPPKVYVRKGETFTVSLVAVDQVNTTIPNSTVLGYLSAEAGLREGQSIQTTGEECTELEYAISSPHSFEMLHVYTNGTCKDIGISLQTVNVTFVPCPIGFKDVNSKCDCDPDLIQYISNCSIDTESVLRKGNIWIAFMNTSMHNGLVIHTNCPFDYCYPSTKPVWINLSNSYNANKQCAFNHSGKLCGSCKDGLSLSLGSSSCMSCSNSWLILLIPFAFAGVALVAFILVCNLTVAVGTINGLIFYANIIAANNAVFLPFNKPNALTIFVAWLNLDLGFETCFYDGLDSYVKTWLQLAFPLYIISLVIAIIMISDYSNRFAALFRGKDPIATLATLILLSYTKLIRTIISSLSFTTLDYSDGSHELVWLTDANVEYLKGKHIPLFITALIIVIIAITYALLLFGWQWINMLCPNAWITKNGKLNIFMDTYQNPYNKDHRYWIGLLLLVRVLLYFVSAVNVLGDPHINLLSINSTVVILFFYQVTLLQKYQIHKRMLIHIIENVSHLNLIFFTSITMYTMEDRKIQHVFAYISTGIALIVFVFVLIYHTFAYLLQKTLQNLKGKFQFHFQQSSTNQMAFEMTADANNLDGEELVSVTEIDALPEPVDTVEDDQVQESTVRDGENQLLNDQDTKPSEENTIHNESRNECSIAIKPTDTATNAQHVFFNEHVNAGTPSNHATKFEHRVSVELSALSLEVIPCTQDGDEMAWGDESTKLLTQ